MYRVPIEYGKVREFAHAVKSKSRPTRARTP